MSYMRCATLLIAFGLMIVAGKLMNAADRPPNIVFMLADDVGFADLHCYGHPYAQTPHLDRLAEQGTRFTQFHVAGITCCPSRTGFMTSIHPAKFAKYPADAGFGNEITVTELLHAAGYATGHFGKWHIGPDTKPGTYGIDNIIVSGGSKKDERGRDASIYDDAIRFIEANKHRPFYINVWGHCTHHRVDPEASLVKRFKDVKVSEGDFSPAMRAKIQELRSLGADVDSAMSKYLADLASLDDAAGRLLQRLEELGLSNDTLVVFSSDHGSGTGATKLSKETEADGDRDSTRFNQMGYNGIHRGGKHTMYEGGTRVPFILRWPGHVPAGRVDQDSVLSAFDWLPTIAKITNVSLPALRVDGEDVSKCWLGGSYQRKAPLFWKTSSAGSSVAMLESQWKLILPMRKNAGQIELYDLRKDGEEATNVAAKHPEVVESMTATAKAWANRLPKEYEKAKNKED